VITTPQKKGLQMKKTKDAGHTCEIHLRNMRQVCFHTDTIQDSKSGQWFCGPHWPPEIVQHTPGPWWFKGGKDGFIENGKGAEIGMVCDGHDDISDLECCANGKLMAAAPELLKAARAFYEKAFETNGEGDRVLTHRSPESEALFLAIRKTEFLV
jgi:hypothetical protein